jgi:hypothetical protein
LIETPSPTRAIPTGLPGERRTKALKAVVVEEFRYNDTKWIYAFVLLELACQISLLFETFSVLRVFVRSAAYLASVFLLFVLRRGPRPHPSGTLAAAAIALVALSTVHPNTNSMAGALAALFFTVTVVGPIFWVPRIRVDVTTVRWLFLIAWSFNSLSAFFGVLQVYYPGRFDPVISTAWASNVVQVLHITLADGTTVRRPMGLTDSPGGAGIGAAFSIILGVGFLLDRPNILFRLILLATVGFSSFALYLCQVRAALVMTVISVLALAMPFLYQRRAVGYVKVVAPMLALATFAFTMAVSVGGKSVTGRLSTLVDNDVETVYYTNRGVFLSATLTDLLPAYPLGAGLGRCGMPYANFGDPYKVGCGPLWAEIQWTEWLYNGGVPLMLLFAGALLVAFRTAIDLAGRVDDRPGRDLYKWATVMVGYTVGMIALTFTGCPFSSTAGVDFWLLNAVVFAASEQLPAA